MKSQSNKKAFQGDSTGSIWRTFEQEIMSYTATEHQGFWSSAHAGFTEYSKFLRESFDPRQTQFLVSSMNSGNTLELSGSDSDVEYFEAIGKARQNSEKIKTVLHLYIVILMKPHSMQILLQL